MAADMSLTYELKPSIRYADLLNYKQWKTPRRVITDYLLLYVQEGSLQLVMDEGVQTLKPGHFLFMQPGIVHQIESLTPLRVMALHVELFPTKGGEYPPMMVHVEVGQPPALEYSQPSFAMLADVTVPLLIKPSRPEWMTESLQRVIEHWSRKNAIDLLQAHVHAAEIMIELIRDHALQGTDELRSSTDLSWVPAYMQYRMAEPLAVEEMARKAFMSRSYFSRLFTQQFGAAPHQFLLRLRINFCCGSVWIPLRICLRAVICRFRTSRTTVVSPAFIISPKCISSVTAALQVLSEKAIRRRFDIS